VGLVRPPVEDPSLELTPLVEEQLVATQASRSHSPGCATTANHSSNIFNGSQPRYGGTEAR
jgi:hypothetical protein